MASGTSSARASPPVASPALSANGSTTSSAATTTLKIPSRPETKRRQSGTRMLANAMRPLFRRSSSQAGTADQSQDASDTSSRRTMHRATGSVSSAGSGARSSRPPSVVGSGPSSPALAGPVQALANMYGTGLSSNSRGTASSSTRSATSLLQSTPSPGTETLHQMPFPSPFFAQATPTSTVPNPMQPPIDFVLPLTELLSRPITRTLSQLIPLHLITPPQYGIGTTLSGPSTVSLATTVQSDAPTMASTTHHTASSVQTPASHLHSSAFSGSTQVFGQYMMPTSTFVTNEQLAASSLNLPTTSVGTIWRLARALDWVTENATTLSTVASATSNPITPQAQSPPSVPAASDSHRQESVFDFAALLQSVLDVVASAAAEQAIDLAYFHVAPTNAQRFGPPAADRGNPVSRFSLPDVQEAYVRGDERGLGVGLIAILKQIFAETRPGACLEIGVSCALTNSPSQPTPHEEGLERASLGQYTCTVEIIHTFSSVQQSPDLRGEKPTYYHPFKILDSAVMSTLLRYLHLSLVTMPSKDGVQVYKVSCVLPQGLNPMASNAPIEPGTRRRKSIDQAREPNASDLLRFVDTSLRGKRVSLHSNENSAFARHVSHHLASWGLDINHVPVLHDDEVDAASNEGHSLRPNRTFPNHLGRFDSGFAGSEGQSPSILAGIATPGFHGPHDPLAGAGRSMPHSDSAASVTSPPLDPQLSFIIIDDDVPTLRRQLTAIRNHAPTMQLQNALLAKRPQLQSRRTRSSQAVQKATHFTISVIHFTSLTNYRHIKEVVHSILKNASPLFPLPEVLVVPKPAGPRRFLTTLFNAVRRPALDPYFVPIATSPASPGGHYFFAGGRPSPALSHSNANDFDVAAGQALMRQGVTPETGSAAQSHASGPRTPPVVNHHVNTDPPSPVSPDALEYFLKSAAELGQNASQGIIIQSPDGRPTGLFFQPRAASLHEKAESMRVARAGRRDSSESVAPQVKQTPPTASIAAGTDLPAIVIPDNMELTQTVKGAFSISPATFSSTSEGTQSFGQRAEALAAAQDQETGVSPSPSKLLRADRDSFSSGSADNEDSPEGEGFNNNSSRISEPSSPKSPHSPTSSRLASGPRSSVGGGQPSPGLTSASKAASPTLKPVTPNAKDAPASPRPLNRTERKSSGRTKKPVRRPTGTLVPPVNVLIVEDNPINQIILSTFLKRKGIKYNVANNGQEAVDMWKAELFHLILMDIQLPVKDGIEATQEIRALERANNMPGFTSTMTSDAPQPTSPVASAVSSPYELPVIIVALTASSLQSDRVNALAAGCNDFLTKPVSLQWLNQKLVEWGSMAYLSAFNSKRRQTLGGQRSRSISEVVEQTPEEKAAAEKAAKEALKARLLASMARKPPRSEKKQAPAPNPVQATLQEEEKPVIRDEPAAQAAVEAGEEEKSKVAQSEESIGTSHGPPGNDEFKAS